MPGEAGRDRRNGEVLALEGFLPYRLNRLADEVSRRFARIYRDQHGMTRPEWRLLATLGQFGTMTATAVGGHSAMHKTKVSRAVAALERRRWLQRRVDGRDRRVEHLSLTPAGAAVYRELVPLARAFEEELARAMGEARFAELDRGLAGLETLVQRARPGDADQSLSG